MMVWIYQFNILIHLLGMLKILKDNIQFLDLFKKELVI